MRLSVRMKLPISCIKTLRIKSSAYSGLLNSQNHGSNSKTAYAAFAIIYALITFTSFELNFVI